MDLARPLGGPFSWSNGRRRRTADSDTVTVSAAEGNRLADSRAAMHYNFLTLSAIILLGFILIVDSRTDSDLSFAESIYVTLSGACRAIADLRQGAMNDQTELLKTLKIVVLDGNKMQLFPIDEAYRGLTQPKVFDITKQTKVVIHGYKDNSQSALPLELGKAYNDKKLFNVLILDAEQMLNQGYIKCVHNTRLIGKRLANVLANLENFGANAEDFHLIGISLGAHVAGWAGKYFLQFKKRRLGRITGLDPAGPCFSHAYSDQRLDKTDANYVDVVHSNRLIQGVIEPLGHADFYLNGGGPNQPGCVMPSCSHLRAAEVYAESIRMPKSFVGVRCQSWKHFVANMCKDEYAVLGYGSSAESRGEFYLRTAGSPPFGLGMQGTVRTKTDFWLRTINLSK